MSIFKIEWDNVVENLMPSFWRKTKTNIEAKLVAYLRSVIAPVQDISDNLYNLQTSTMSFLDYNGQHLALENYLNDLYDNTQRRIYITENNKINELTVIDLYKQNENDPTPISIYKQGESPLVPFALYLQTETLGVTYNFTINIPASVTFDSTTLTRLVKNYSEAAKTFNIITF